tara:strand:+ start:2249 stop:3277 length:1029 start_codon:yes stop_codon:yes gene_type:complete
MDNISVHMRISGVTVSDDDVNSRRSAATNLATSWRKERTLSKIISKAADVAEALGGDGNPSPSLGLEIQSAIQKKSSAFLYQERPLDVSVCAGMAMVSIFAESLGDSGWATADIYATALWSALGYQSVLDAERRENLRREVFIAAEHRALVSAENARARKNVPDPSEIKIVLGEGNVVNHNFQAAMADTIEALRRNAALDREELDFLWWAQLGRSRLLNRELSSINEPTRIVAAGIEGARMLRRLPCDVHREVVLRTLDQDPELDLVEMIAAVGEDRIALGAEFVGGNVAAHPNVFPFLHALASGDVEGSGAAVKRHVSEWGSRALLEAGFNKMLAQGAAKL